MRGGRASGAPESGDSAGACSETVLWFGRRAGRRGPRISARDAVASVCAPACARAKAVEREPGLFRCMPGAFALMRLFPKLAASEFLSFLGHDR